MAPITIRERAAVVGYEGAAAYLGPWRGVVEAACRKLGLQFVVNPTDLRSIDIGLAARGGVHASTMARRYKSNVKLANFYGAAIPCVVDDGEVSYHETDDGSVRFFTTEQQLVEQLAELRSYETRLRIHQSFLETRERYTLEAIAAQYDEYFARLAMPRSA
jgi:glycosyltransferase involved in cell wall biosynthesis